MSGFKTKNPGLLLSHPPRWEQFWQTGRDIIRHSRLGKARAPAKPSIPMEEAKQKPGWQARGATRVPDVGSTHKPHPLRPRLQAGTPMLSALLRASPDGLAVRRTLLAGGLAAWPLCAARSSFANASIVLTLQSASGAGHGFLEE